LDVKFDHTKAIEELKTIDSWIDTVNNKKVINFQGSLDITERSSADKHAKNPPYNENMDRCPTIKGFFERFGDLAKCRAFKMGRGSYFGPHRDAWRYNEQFRIFIALNKTEKEKWIFFYDGQFVQFKPGVPYILNTRKIHGSFAMADDIYHISMSIFLNKENLDAVMDMLPHRQDLPESQTRA
jgi:hypothetical protein